VSRSTERRALNSIADSRGNACANALKPALDAYNTVMAGVVSGLGALDTKAVADMKTLLGSSSGGTGTGTGNGTATATPAAGAVSQLQANAGKGDDKKADDKKDDNPFKAWEDTVPAGFVKQLQDSDAAHDALSGELKKLGGASPCSE
jgi:hypothetical protein